MSSSASLLSLSNRFRMLSMTALSGCAQSRQYHHVGRRQQELLFHLCQGFQGCQGEQAQTLPRELQRAHEHNLQCSQLHWQRQVRFLSSFAPSSEGVSECNRKTHFLVVLRSFSSNRNSPPAPPSPKDAEAYSLRRPPPMRTNRPGSQQAIQSARSAPINQIQRNLSPEPSDETRPGVVVLFPGDYTDDILEDDENNENNIHNWDDDDEAYDDDNSFEDDDEASDELLANEKIVRSWKEMDEKQKEQKERWLKNALPPVRTSIVDERGRSYGRGGRKTAAARVWIQPGFGEIVVNRRPFDEYFTRLSHRDLVVQPLVATETIGEFDVQCLVKGGGSTGQAGAIRHGLARALNNFNPDTYRPTLKVLGYLTRDARMVERKNIGHKKARKAPQWVRR